MGIVERLTGSARDRFATEALKIARRAPGVTGARYDRDQFAIAVWYGGESARVWIRLSNVYAECAGASRSERRDRVAHLVQVMTGLEADDGWESVRPRLRPVLRSA